MNLIKNELKLKITLNVVFYNPKQNDINQFINLSKNFEYSQCYLNSKIEKKNHHLLELNKINIMGIGKNIGLSKAYNILIKNQIKNFNFAFIIDQDSRFDAEILNSFFNEVKDKFNSQNNLAIVSMKPKNDLNSSYIMNPNNKISRKFRSLPYVINSGSLLYLKAWLDIGGYDEELFIDKIDFNFCKSLRIKNWVILQSQIYYFNHSLGRPKKFLLGIIKYNSYNKKRHYYIMKSRIYTFLKFNNRSNILDKIIKLFFLLIQIIKHIYLVLIFENNKKVKLNFLFKGIKESL